MLKSSKYEKISEHCVSLVVYFFFDVKVKQLEKEDGIAYSPGSSKWSFIRIY